jgi:hypothetical protein
MPIYDLFSKRRKRVTGDVPDVYSYDQIPQNLRAQIIHIWGDALGNPARVSDSRGRASWFVDCANVVRRLQEHGDPWQLSEELPNPTGKGHSTPLPIEKG